MKGWDWERVRSIATEPEPTLRSTTTCCTDRSRSPTQSHENNTEATGRISRPVALFYCVRNLASWLGLIRHEHRLHGRDDSLRHVRVLDAPQQLLDAAAADELEAEIKDGRPRVQAQQERLLVVDRD